MRILVPGNQVDFKLRAQKPQDGIDPKMVWNVCPQSENQLTFALIEPAPAARPSGFQFPMLKSGEKKQAEFPFLKHLSPFAKLPQ
jgi:hypothetical protein